MPWINGQVEAILIGQICEAFICEGFEHKGELDSDCNVCYIRANHAWYRFCIDAGQIFWWDYYKTPQPWEVAEEGWKYPHRNIGEEFALIGKRIISFQETDYNDFEWSCFIRIGFEDGKQFLLEDENDHSTFRIIEKS